MLTTYPVGEPVQHTPDRARMRHAAQEVEVRFLSEMLQAAGLGKVSEHHGGGIGEERFASLLAEEQARAMVHAGGIGLSEAIFNAMAERMDE